MVYFTISANNLTTSNTTLLNEYILIMEYLDFKFDDIVKFNINAINASFASDKLKKKLIVEITNSAK